MVNQRQKKKFKFILILGIIALTSGVAIAGSDFSKEDFQRLLSGDKDLSCTRLEGCDLKSKDLSGYNFSNADLEESDLSGANLSNVNFQHTNLEEANLQGANLAGANFFHADLEGANLKGANIKNTNFKNAELEYAIWTDGKVCAEGSIGGCW